MKLRVLTILIAVLLVNSAYGVEKDKRSANGLDKTTTGVNWAKYVKQGFSMQVWLSNQIAMGIEAWDPLPVPVEDCGVGIGLDFPAGGGSCIEHLFGMGPMVGGIINGRRYVSQSYEEGAAEHEFVPERKDTSRDRIWRTSKTEDNMKDYYFNPARTLLQPVNRRACDDDGDGLIDEDELDNFDNDGDWVAATDDVGTDGKPDSLETGCKGGYDPVKNHDPAYDNYEPAARDSCHPDPETGALLLKRNKDLYTEKNGIPDHGEPRVDEDYGAVSDQDYYMYATDTAKSAPGAVGTNHFPMGVKIFMKTYAWRGGPGSFGYGIMPIDYYIINVGRNTIHEMYIGMNADMDVGPVNIPNYFQHDYACYMPDLRTAYIHNAQDRGSTPLGMTVLGTPVPLDQLQYVFQWYDGGQLGNIDSIVYTWLDGTQFGGNLIKQCKPPETPADCRVFFSFGPFRGANDAGFKPGDTLKISMALVSGDGVEGTENSMRASAERALRMYQNGYVPPIIPPSPALKVTEGFKKVTLQWYPHASALGGLEGPYDVWDDSNKIADAYPDTSFRRINPPCQAGAGGCNGGHVCNGRLPGGRIIEGFRLYRSEDPGNLTPAKSAFTLLKQFDLADDPFEFNVGVESTFVDTNLTRGKRYWYAVTSFSIPNITVLATPADSTGAVYSYDTVYSAPVESDISENAKRVDLTFSTADNAGQVLVVPNPYRVDHDYTYESGGWEGRTSVWTENSRLVKFIHLPTKCTIRVFTLVGDHVATIEHNDPVRGEESWNLLSESNRALASGVYIFTVEAYDPTQADVSIGKQVGKFVLIR